MMFYTWSDISVTVFKYSCLHSQKQSLTGHSMCAGSSISFSSRIVPVPSPWGMRKTRKVGHQEGTFSTVDETKHCAPLQVEIMTLEIEAAHAFTIPKMIR